MMIQRGGTFHPRIVTTPGEDWTGRTVTLAIARSVHAIEDDEALRITIACGVADGSGVVGEETVSAADMRDALPAGQYWLGGALAIPVEGEDDIIVPFAPVPLSVSQSLPTIPEAAGAGSTATCTGVAYDITLSGDGPLILTVSIPSLITYPSGDPSTLHSDLTGRDAEDSHPQAAITGLPEALAAKEDAGTADAAVAAHLIAAPHIAAPENASTLAKITESAGLPLWDGGAWPGGTGSAAPSEVEALGTASSAEAITLHAATHGGGTLTLAAGAYPTVTLSGAVDGALYQYVLTATNQGVSYPVFTGVHWAVGHAPDWSVAGTWEIVLRTTDGGTVISGAAYYRAIVGTRRIWYSDWSATDTTDLASVVPTPGAALSKVASGGKITASATMRTRGGHVEAVVSASTASTYAAYTADLGTSDYTIRINSTKPMSSQLHRPALLVCYVDSSNFVAVTRAGVIADVYAVVDGVESTLGTISLANHTSGTLIDILVTKVGASLAVTFVGVQPFGSVTINSLPNPSSTMFGIGVRTANTSADTSMVLGDVEVIGS